MEHQPSETSPTEHVDLVIVGAGLSGIGMASHFVRECPDKRYIVLETRHAIGGTWDLFRYPGIRSDSDMHTLGYEFKPWTDPKTIADGPAILDYIKEAAQENDIEKHIRFHHHVIKANWSDATSRWTLTVENLKSKELKTLTCNFLSLCAGYYHYDKGHTPDFKGSNDFRGDIIHPQFWPENYNHKDKHIIVIGSGATAVTLVPSLAEKAAHVTMLQRSPSYIAPMPSSFLHDKFLRSILPNKLAYRLIRWKNIQLQQFLYKRMRKNPSYAKRRIRNLIQKYLGKDYTGYNHFTPTYNPWDERLCLDPDGGFFNAVKNGKADIVTDTIERITEDGVMLSSGNHLNADLIITATGIEISLMGNIDLSVNNKPITISETFGYKGMMFSDIPNCISVFGYTNASWTLRADLISNYVCRIIQYMDQNGFSSATPKAPKQMTAHDWFEFQPGYIRRALHKMPKQGDQAPWINPQDYTYDIQALRHDKLDDGHIIYS